MPGDPGIATFAGRDGELAQPTGIIAGPDGAIWFTSIANGRLGRVRPDGELETFEDPAGRIRLLVGYGQGAEVFAHDIKQLLKG